MIVAKECVHTHIMPWLKLGAKTVTPLMSTWFKYVPKW